MSNFQTPSSVLAAAPFLEEMQATLAEEDLVTELPASKMIPIRTTPDREASEPVPTRRHPLPRTTLCDETIFNMEHFDHSQEPIHVKLPLMPDTMKSASLTEEVICLLKICPGHTSQVEHGIYNSISWYFQHIADFR